MNSKIKFYEGVTGDGIVASIAYGKSRVIFDFGGPFNPMTQPYDGQVEKREKSWVRDAISLGQIPPVDGVFSEKDLGDESDVTPYEGSEYQTGVIISHLHLDHMSGIGMIHPDIPVYLHEDGYKLQKLLDQIGESVGERDYTPIKLYQPFWIGDIKVTAYYSDHPCAGAVGYLIETPDGKYFYSGDVRMHGGNLEKVLEDLDKLAAEEIDVLILEATTFSPKMYERFGDEPLKPSLAIPAGMISEQELLEQVERGLADSSSLGIFNIYHRDMELIKGLFDVARATQREIVFEPKTAYVVMNMIGEYPPVFIPDNEEYEDSQAAYLQYVLEKTPKVVGYEDILAAPHKYFLQNSYENILELFDLAVKGADYFHLYGVPMVKGSRDYENMERVLKLTNTNYAAFANLFSYNHAYPNNLIYIAKAINAKYLIPVHSTNPELFECKASIRLLAEKMATYVLEDGVLKKE